MSINVILISGKQGSGKSTLAENLEHALRSYARVTVAKFAAPLYDMHREIRSVLQRVGADNMDSNLIDGPLLQLLGTEWGRKTRGEDFWANIAKKRVAVDIKLHGHNKRKSIYIFDDCRFENEIKAFDAQIGYNVVRVRLEAPENVRKERARKWRENTDHPSEIGLDHWVDWDVLSVTDTTDRCAATPLRVVEYMKSRELL